MKGTHYYFPQILLDLHRNQKTGTLTVRTPGITKRVYVKKGQAIFASSTSEDDRLGETLIKLGQITYRQYEESVEILKKTGKKQGAILVELGYLTPKDLILAVQYQVREIVYSLFRLKDADHEFEEGSIPANEVITLQMSMGKLIYEGLKRNDNISVIRREMPELQAILRPTAHPSDLVKDITLSPQDEEMLSSIDAAKTVRDLLKTSSSTSFDAMKSIYVLCALGFIELQENSANEPEAAANEDEGAGVDSTVIGAKKDVPIVETEGLHPEGNIRTDTSFQKPFHFAPLAKVDSKDTLSPPRERSLEPETEKWWNTSAVEAEPPSNVVHEPSETIEVQEITDRRRHKRFKVEGAQVKGEMLFRKEVQVLDMSMSGIQLQTDRQLKIGKAYLLNLQNEDKIISVKAIVVRSLLSESKTDDDGDVVPLYLVGMQFINLSDEKIDEIVEFIDNHKAGDQPILKTNGKMEYRKSTRFEMNVDGKTILNFHELYKVKVISLNGMLIESSHCLDIEDKLHMKIILPGDQAIDFVGRVASCSEKGEGDEKHYDIGIEFTTMPEDHKNSLEEFFKNIEDISKCDISAVQTEAPESTEKSESPSLNTGDADLYILQGKYADAMAIYNELLSKEPENIHILKRIEALATLSTNVNNKKEAPPRSTKAHTGELTRTSRRKADEKPSRNNTSQSNKAQKKGSPDKWYGKFVRRIMPG